MHTRVVDSTQFYCSSGSLYPSLSALCSRFRGPKSDGQSESQSNIFPFFEIWCTRQTKCKKLKWHLQQLSFQLFQSIASDTNGWIRVLYNRSSYDTKLRSVNKAGNSLLVPPPFSPSSSSIYSISLLRNRISRRRRCLSIQRKWCRVYHKLR